MDLVFFISYVLLWVIAVVQGFVIVECLRQIGILRLRLGDEPGALIDPESLPRGAVAPPFSLLDAQTGALVNEAALKGRRSLLIFVSPTCAPCRDLALQLPRVATLYRELNIVAVCSGPADRCRDFAHEFALPFPTLVDDAQTLTRAFGASRTPHAYLLDPDRRVLIQGIPADLQQLEHLIDEEGTLMGDRSWVHATAPSAVVDPSSPEMMRLRR